jgi:hypothetical protein
VVVNDGRVGIRRFLEKLLTESRLRMGRMNRISPVEPAGRSISNMNRLLGLEKTQ